MVLPRGAWPTGLKSNTLSAGPYLFTWTWKPACWRVWVAWATGIPIGLGTLTSWGPVDTWTLMVSPGWKVEPAAGCCPVMVPAGCWLLLSGCCCSVTPCWPAHCWAVWMFSPKKLGSGEPAEIRMVTGLVCGQVVPAAGWVPTTEPTGRLETTFWGALGTRCKRCSAAWAWGRVSCCTLGTTEVKGPLETTSAMAARQRGRACQEFLRTVRPGQSGDQARAAV